MKKHENKFHIINIDTFLLNSCVTNQIVSVVDNTLFTNPYKKPIFIMEYNDKKEGKIANKIINKLRVSFAETSIDADFKVIDGNEYFIETDKQKFIDTITNNNKNDIVFTIKLEKINLYNGEVSNFTYLIVGYDKNTQKEVWKSRVLSFGSEFDFDQNGKAVLDKLQFDKVL